MWVLDPYKCVRKIWIQKVLALQNFKYKYINFHKDPYPRRTHKNGSKIPPKIMDTPTLKGPGPTYMCRKNLDPKNPDGSNAQI